jgi:hypothetical protein
MGGGRDLGWALEIELVLIGADADVDVDVGCGGGADGSPGKCSRVVVLGEDATEDVVE